MKNNSITKGLGIFDDIFVIPLAELACKTKISKKINPYFLSILKFLLIFSFIFALFLVNPLLLKLITIFLIFYLYSLFDRLDGAFARIQHKASRLGSIIDIFIDKLFEITMILCLGAYFLKLELFILLAIWILSISLIGLILRKDNKRQENLYDYTKNLDFKKFIILLILIFTRNDMRKFIILISLLLYLPNLVIYYFFITYLIFLIHLLNRL